MGHDAGTLLSSMSLVSKAALAVPVLIPVRCLWWPLLLRLRHRFYGREAWCTGNTEPPPQGRVAGLSCFRHGFMDHGAEMMLSSMSLVSKAALPVSVLIVVRCLWWPLLIRLQHRLSDTVWRWYH